MVNNLLFFFSSFFFCWLVVWCEAKERGKTIFISTSSLSSSLARRKLLFCILVFFFVLLSGLMGDGQGWRGWRGCLRNYVSSDVDTVDLDSAFYLCNLSEDWVNKYRNLGKIEQKSCVVKYHFNKQHSSVAWSKRFRLFLFSYAVWSNFPSPGLLPHIITCLFTDFVLFLPLLCFSRFCWWKNFLLSLIFLSPLWGYATRRDDACGKTALRGGICWVFCKFMKR